jgi:asparaginyl-tRNA synthetase
MAIEIKKIYIDYVGYKDKEVLINGWVRNNRSQKEFGFIDLNDGTTLETVQVVYEAQTLENFKEVSKFRVGSSSI